jgi:cysteine synthase A
MTAEEIEISKSTPTARFDQPSTPPVAKPEEAKPAAAAAPDDAEAAATLAEVLGDKDKPVVMFALEWCEFCWSVRRFFARLGIDYRSVDLDSVALQENNMGGRIRAAVSAQTGIRTIPQIFVGGTLVGGCTEVFDAYRSGELQKLLDASSAAYDKTAQLDPYGFFPAWLQSRQAVAQSDEAAE